MGAFPVGKASGDIIDAWIRHRQRSGDSGGLTVVFERGVEGETALGEFNRPLGESLGHDSKLRASIATAAKKRGLGESDVLELFDRTVVFGVSWSYLEENSRTLLGTVFPQLRPSIIDYLARELRTLTGETARLNAPVVYDDRHSLDRNELIRQSHDFVEQVDLDALDAAITQGLCSPLSLTEELHDARFYEGVSTQPGHVAAGLVVPRTELIDEAVAGIQETSSVILTGPSGVGKSALLWSIPHALPGILWFRVNRLSSHDVPKVLRLCRSYRVSEANPIGLLIDAAGTGQFSGWSQLREATAAAPGLFMVSTARHEDLISLGDLSGSATITVELNEEAAEVIFDSLCERKATESPHWREAFEQSEGLTLEFTHLLTRGERIDAVIGDQVRRRITEHRNIELDLLSLSTTADRWSATLPVGKAAEACGVTQLELREPLARLAEEHLLVERNGTILGVHQLRSTAISNAIHDQPPPALNHTISRLLLVLAPEEVRKFVPNLLRDKPELDQLIHESALLESRDVKKLAAYLRGLRLYDFYERAVKWTDIADRHGIPPANQPVAQFCAIAGSDLSDLVPEEFTSAVSDMAASPESARGAALIAAIGPGQLAEELVAIDDVVLANELLFEFQGSAFDIAVETQSALLNSNPLGTAMQRASITQFANFMATANSLSPALAQTLIQSLGGEAEIEVKIRNADPWIIDLRIDESSGEAVAYARVLHVSDTTHGDPHDRVIQLGRLLLRCFPRTTHVDVKLQLPGGHDYQVGDHQVGSTELRREYDHSELSTAWNQERIRVTNVVLGATDTERLSATLPLFEAAARLTRIVGNAFVAADMRGIGTEELTEQIDRLNEDANQIGPRLNRSLRALDVSGDQEASSLSADPLVGLLTDLTSNIFPRLAKLANLTAIAAHLSDHVIGRSLHQAMEEPWHLLGYDTFPDSLKTLETDLHRLLAVVAALAEVSSAKAAIVHAARSGPHEGALDRAAEVARDVTKRRQQDRKAELERVGLDIGWRFRVYMSTDDRYQLAPERLIALDVPSLVTWSNALEEIAVALRTAGMPGEKFVLVPIRNGRPVETLAMSLIDSLLPTGTLGHWAAELLQPQDVPLSEAFDAAVASIQVVSGILVLTEQQRTHGAVVQVLEDAKQGFGQSKGVVEQTPIDAVTEQIVFFLDALEEQLTNEESGNATRGDIASQMARLVTAGEQTEFTTSLVLARLMSLEWDIDPHAAPRLFQLS
ncbi:hypothetical protein [Brevibacterium permense]|uniref:hypothetical protein n=1 Tax=Brevibacterium permense TaxID=234834 RepID=UPI0021D3DC88|nr:hypothetical protein [Brevibacterium permense]